MPRANRCMTRRDSAGRTRAESWQRPQCLEERLELGPFLTWTQTLWNAFLLPMKRHYGEPWFRPVARYGTIGSEVDFLEPDPDPG